MAQRAGRSRCAGQERLAVSLRVPAAGKAPVVGSSFTEDLPQRPDGVVDDWVRLEYDPALPDLLRRHLSKGRASSNYKQFLIEGDLLRSVFRFLVDRLGRIRDNLSTRRTAGAIFFATSGAVSFGDRGSCFLSIDSRHRWSPVPAR